MDFLEVLFGLQLLVSFVVDHNCTQLVFSDCSLSIFIDERLRDPNVPYFVFGDWCAAKATLCDAKNLR